MCKVLGVQSNNYYSFHKRNKNTVNDTTNQEMLELVKDIARLMKEANIWVRYKKKYKVTTNSDRNKPLYKNELEQNFTTELPNQALFGEMTYIWTAEGWLYLAVVIDLYSRKVVGWSMGSRMKSQLVCDALTMAIWQTNPDKGLIVHSDQGVQYASHQYRKLLKDNGFIGSMSKKGCCWDNAVAESFFSSLKQ
ncbi:MAG: IS3 family transposase, partial [Colwellia sp.]|nr:IS3 family transposase [Colwellia sp.]